MASGSQNGAAIAIGARPRTHATAALLARGHWQLLLGLALAVALPAFVRWPDSTVNLSDSSLNHAIYATAAALLLGYWLTCRLAVFPGLQAISYVLPTFSLSYGLMAAALLLTRHGYSRFHLLASFAIAVVFFHYAFLVERRTKQLRLALVPGGHGDEVSQVGPVEWIVWDAPDEVPEDCDGLVADLHADLGEDWTSFLARCALAGVPVYHSKQVLESLTGRVAIEHLSENTLGSLLPSSLYKRVKAAADFAIALLALPFVLPICLLAGLLIRLESPGPALFVQERVGFRGRIFRIYKLRTMRTAAEGSHFTEERDPRITRLGAFLRKYRIDELPQVLNILKGEMSWIGPRPESVPLSEWYDGEIPFYSYRHIVRPGITGWAQIHQGNVARPEAAKYKLHYDFYYIKHFSLWLDFVISAQTVRTILTGFGSR